MAVTVAVGIDSGSGPPQASSRSIEVSDAMRRLEAILMVGPVVSCAATGRPQVRPGFPIGYGLLSGAHVYEGGPKPGLDLVYLEGIEVSYQQ